MFPTLDFEPLASSFPAGCLHSRLPPPLNSLSGFPSGVYLTKRLDIPDMRRYTHGKGSKPYDRQAQTQHYPGPSMYEHEEGRSRVAQLTSRD
jgi:hypothetical protein